MENANNVNHYITFSKIIPSLVLKIEVLIKTMDKIEIFFAEEY